MLAPQGLLNHPLFFELLHNVAVDIGGQDAVLYEEDGICVTLEDVLEQYAATHDSGRDDPDAPAFQAKLQHGVNSRSSSRKWPPSRYQDGPHAAGLPEICWQLGVSGFKPFSGKEGKELSDNDVNENLQYAEEAVLQLLLGEQAPEC